MGTVAQNLGLIEKAKIVITDKREEQVTKKSYEVQFNPSSLSLRGRGQGFMPVLTFDKQSNPAKNAKQSVRITMSVRLVIDQVVNFTSFTEDKLNLSPTQIAANIAVLTAQKASNKPNVQQTVEGLIAALRSQYTREIDFFWGTMHYKGILNNVSAQYVMFDTAGHPVRAYINLSLLCVENVNPETLGIWEAAYEAAFSGDTLDTTNAGQIAPNLLNLG
ncbi:MAG: hypothetical protein K6E19_02140 [Lachnospiraceae bacterium]|nr:hypothetical protein [Lachnospiraceae bacterium]